MSIWCSRKISCYMSSLYGRGVVLPPEPDRAAGFWNLLDCQFVIYLLHLYFRALFSYLPQQPPEQSALGGRLVRLGLLLLDAAEGVSHLRQALRRAALRLRHNHGHTQLRGRAYVPVVGH